MSIKYEPSKLLKKIAPSKRVKRLLTGNLSLKKAALTFADAFDFLDKSALSRVALKTIRGYQERVAKAVVDADYKRSAGSAVKNELLDDPKQLVQRIQNEVVLQIGEEIRDRYAGESYKWLPSDAEEPDPEHQLNYGEIFQIGDGEQPGDRYGCRCGMEILVKETKLKL